MAGGFFRQSSAFVFERVEANRALVARLGNPGGEVGEARYQQATARIRRTRPAYEAYDEAQKAFKERMPGGPVQGQRGDPDRAGRGAVLRPARGEIRAARDDDKAALKDLDRAVALNPITSALC